MGKFGKKRWILTGLLFLLLASAGCGKQIGNGNAGEAREGQEGQEEQGQEAGKGQEREKAQKGGLQAEKDGAFAYVDSMDRLYLWRQGGDTPVLLTDKFLVLTADMAEEDSADSSGADIRNFISFAPDHKKIYFPSSVQLRRFGGSGMTVVYDLYCYGEDGKAEPVAEGVTDYQVDGDGRVWYSRVTGDSSMSLYLAEGENQIEIGEMGNPAKADFQISGDGSYVAFQGKDGGLYGKRDGGDTVKLAERAEGKFYLSEDSQRCVYRAGNEIGVADTSGQRQIGTAETEDGGKVYLLDVNAKQVLIVEEEKVTYGEVLENDMDAGDDTERLWELFSGTEAKYDIRKGRIRLFDTETGQLSLLAEGYLTDSIEYEEMEPFRGFYFFEMIPTENYRKVPVSAYCNPYTAEEVVAAYGYQGETALEGNGLYWYEQAQGYIVCGGELRRLDGMELSGQAEVRRTYNKRDKKFYVRIIRSIPRYEGQLYFMDEAAAAGEDVYEFDEDGNYRKVAETVQQALVKGDSLYYLRTAASGRFQRLYRLDGEGYLAQSGAINLDQMQKAEKTGELFYLTGSYGIGSRFPGELNCNDGIGNKRMAERIYEFRLYGGNCVAALQSTLDPESDAYYEVLLTGGGTQFGRLLVFEDGTEKVLAEEVIFLLGIGGDS